MQHPTFRYFECSAIFSYPLMANDAHISPLISGCIAQLLRSSSSSVSILDAREIKLCLKYILVKIFSKHKKGSKGACTAHLKNRRPQPFPLSAQRGLFTKSCRHWYQPADLCWGRRAFWYAPMSVICRQQVHWSSFRRSVTPLTELLCATSKQGNFTMVNEIWASQAKILQEQFKGYLSAKVSSHHNHAQRPSPVLFTRWRVFV